MPQAAPVYAPRQPSRPKLSVIPDAASALWPLSPSSRTAASSSRSAFSPSSSRRTFLYGAGDPAHWGPEQLSEYVSKQYEAGAHGRLSALVRGKRLTGYSLLELDGAEEIQSVTDYDEQLGRALLPLALDLRGLLHSTVRAAPRSVLDIFPTIKAQLGTPSPTVPPLEEDGDDADSVSFVFSEAEAEEEAPAASTGTEEPQARVEGDHEDTFMSPGAEPAAEEPAPRDADAHQDPPPEPQSQTQPTAAPPRDPLTHAASPTSTRAPPSGRVSIRVFSNAQVQADLEPVSPPSSHLALDEPPARHVEDPLAIAANAVDEEGDDAREDGAEFEDVEGEEEGPVEGERVVGSAVAGEKDRNPTERGDIAIPNIAETEQPRAVESALPVGTAPLHSGAPKVAQETPSNAVPLAYAPVNVQQARGPLERVSSRRTADPTPLPLPPADPRTVEGALSSGTPNVAQEITSNAVSSTHAPVNVQQARRLIERVPSRRATDPQPLPLPPKDARTSLRPAEDRASRPLLTVDTHVPNPVISGLRHSQPTFSSSQSNTERAKSSAITSQATSANHAPPTTSIPSRDGIYGKVSKAAGSIRSPGKKALALEAEEPKRSGAPARSATPAPPRRAVTGPVIVRPASTIPTVAPGPRNENEKANLGPWQSTQRVGAYRDDAGSATNLNGAGEGDQAAAEYLRGDLGLAGHGDKPSAVTQPTPTWKETQLKDAAKKKTTVSTKIRSNERPSAVSSPLSLGTPVSSTRPQTPAATNQDAAGSDPERLPTPPHAAETSPGSEPPKKQKQGAKPVQSQDGSKDSSTTPPVTARASSQVGKEVEDAMASTITEGRTWDTGDESGKLQADEQEPRPQQIPIQVSQSELRSNVSANPPSISPPPCNSSSATITAPASDDPPSAVLPPVEVQKLKEEECVEPAQRTSENQALEHGEVDEDLVMVNLEDASGAEMSSEQPWDQHLCTPDAPAAKAFVVTSKQSMWPFEETSPGMPLYQVLTCNDLLGKGMKPDSLVALLSVPFPDDCPGRSPLIFGTSNTSKKNKLRDTYGPGGSVREIHACASNATLKLAIDVITGVIQQAPTVDEGELDAASWLGMTHKIRVDDVDPDSEYAIISTEDTKDVPASAVDLTFLEQVASLPISSGTHVAEDDAMQGSPREDGLDSFDDMPALEDAKVTEESVEEDEDPEDESSS